MYMRIVVYKVVVVVVKLIGWWIRLLPSWQAGWEVEFGVKWATFESGIPL